MPWRSTARRSLPNAPPRPPANEVVVISSDDEQKLKIVPETPSPRPSTRSRRSTGQSATTFGALSNVPTPATGRSSRTASTLTSGSHTPATSIEGDLNDDHKTDFALQTLATASPRSAPKRKARQASKAVITIPSDTGTDEDSDSLPKSRRKILGSKRKMKEDDENEFKPSPNMLSQNLVRSRAKRLKVEDVADRAASPQKDVLDVVDPEYDHPDIKQSPRSKKGKAKLTIFDDEDEDDFYKDNSDEDYEDAPLAQLSRRQGQSSAIQLGSSKVKGHGQRNYDALSGSEDDLPLAFRYPRERLGSEYSDNDLPFGVSRHFESDEHSDDSDLVSEHEYETVKQRERRLRSEAHRARLKQVDQRSLYDKNMEKLIEHHPELENVWEELQKTLAIIKPQKAEQPKGINISLLPFQLEGLYWMTHQESSPWKGGLLADEMGMGKTIQMISLMLVDRKKPCLVVAPTVAIMQWRNEIQKYTDPQLSVILWHGSMRTQNVKELQSADVVLTSYAVLESCFRKQESGFRRKQELVKEKSVLHAIHWRRIILDEAHNIKERSTNTAKGAFALKGDFRWCLSGTPLQNRVGELYSMIRFLGGDPFAYYFCKKCPCKSLHWSFSDRRNCDSCGHTPMHHTCYWNNEILKPIQRGGTAVGEGADAFKRLRLLLERIMLRRTKLERADDMGLPPRTIEVRRDLFNEEEEDLYTSLYTDTTRKFSTYLDAGTVLNNYSNIFTLLTRMRQLANHPDLVLRSQTGIASKLLGDDQSEIHVCRLCNDEAEDAIMSRCRHIFCRECVRQYLDSELQPGAVPDCPHCHATLSIDLEAEALEPPQSTIKMNDNGRQGILARLDMDKWRSSTKIEALVEELTQLRTDDKTIKSLVFSQFVNFLDLIAFRLQRAGFSICRLEGNMSPEARNRTIKHFMENPNVTVFLVSLKAGGVALNLTEASRVYLMDPWWNPSVEVQAMDRIHRLGQHRPIIVKRMVIENSIESRIIELQNKKSAMIEAAIGKDDAAMGRLSVSDLRFLFTL